MPAEDQVIIIYAGVNAFLDKVVTADISKFERLFLEHVKSKHKNILDSIRTQGVLDKTVEKELRTVLEEFIPSSGIQLKDK